MVVMMTIDKALVVWNVKVAISTEKETESHVEGGVLARIECGVDP